MQRRSLSNLAEQRNPSRRDNGAAEPGRHFAGTWRRATRLEAPARG